MNRSHERPDARDIAREGNMLSDNRSSQSSAFTGKAAGNGGFREDATTRRPDNEDAEPRHRPDWSQNARDNGFDWSQAFAHHYGFPPFPTFGGGAGPAPFSYAPFPMPPFPPPGFGMPPPAMAPFGVWPFAMPPYGMTASPFAFAQHEGHSQWDLRGPWQNRSFDSGSWSSWSWLTSLWSWLMPWFSWLMSSLPRSAIPFRPQPGFEWMFHSGITAADAWSRWLDTVAQAAWHTRNAYEAMHAGATPQGQHAQRRTAPPDNSIDMNKLREALGCMDPMQASQVVHAVQMMNAMERMHRAQQSRPQESGAQW
jgi:hypothetical protein